MQYDLYDLLVVLIESYVTFLVTTLYKTNMNSVP